MKPWWEVYPEQLEDEVEGLKLLGYRYEIDAAAKQAGLLRIEVEAPYKEEPLKLEAVYPATYPYFPPHVYLRNHAFERHHHPVGKGLCLLEREGADWRPGQETLADLIRGQLPEILRINEGEAALDDVAAHEDHVGEPFSSFLSYLHGCMVIVPDETPPSEIAAGKLTIRARQKPIGWKERFLVNGALEKISDLRERPLVEFKPTVPAFSKSYGGYWLRLAERPALSLADAPKYFTELMMERVPAFKRALDKAKPGEVFVLGFVYPDEVSWRENDDDWFFVAVDVVRRGQSRIDESYFVRADWGGENAWMRRAPSLKPLRKRSALVVGLGSLGSPLALHLARAGIKDIHLIDYDHLQVGNSIRWALGWQYAGFSKVAAVASHLKNEYPYTESYLHSLRLGDVTYPSNDYEFLRGIIDKVDLIVDASASYRVSHFLADLAQELRKPYVWLTTTHGTAGGVVGRVLPGKAAGCWHCFQRRLADETIRRPADSGDAEIQPGGCAQATFIGAGINSDEVALLAGRLAVATLCRDEEGGYPDFAWNVAVGDFTRDDVSIAPAWDTYALDVHPDCENCKAKQ